MSGIINSAGSKSGVIYKPRCHFIMAYSSDDGWQNIASNVDIPWSSIEVDEDNCCTSGTGAHFTAPIVGTYFFGAVLYVGDSDSTNYFTFYINNSLPNYMSAGDHYYSRITDDVDGSGNPHIIFKLNAGSTVSCTASGASRLYTGHSLFYGHRID